MMGGFGCFEGITEGEGGTSWDGGSGGRELGDSGREEWVVEGLRGGEALTWVVGQHTKDEVMKGLVVHALALPPATHSQHISQLPAARTLVLVSISDGVGGEDGVCVGGGVVVMVGGGVMVMGGGVSGEKLFKLGALFDHLLWRVAEHLYDLAQLVGLVEAMEDGFAYMNFHQDATHAPDVDRQVVGQA